MSRNLLIIIIAVIVLALLITGGLVEALRVLLYIGLVLAVIALIVWLVRYLTGRKTR
ncbi:hypothetical protein [Homoserinibacter sp. YIM 151385]|uniref:hypothetical protein n=1 Tax=Homoserinibacter sp. YIM 151385 TaxID=2985506 RepID=UPI0022F082DF|nr:hypothetical protein [Homoserinibacter sp. YIM 151385]WBU37611.1 hypothetical protein OF852_11925 [Homoserinibacter sp. YIM 151385]